jgi:hypothetical protein
MDALDLFLKKYSYKFPKGYPDLGNKSDMILLESLLNEILDETVTLIREGDAEEAIDLLKKELNLKDGKFNTSFTEKYKYFTLFYF